MYSALSPGGGVTFPDTVNAGEDSGVAVPKTESPTPLCVNFKTYCAGARPTRIAKKICPLTCPSISGTACSIMSEVSPSVWVNMNNGLSENTSIAPFPFRSNQISPSAVAPTGRSYSH